MSRYDKMLSTRNVPPKYLHKMQHILHNKHLTVSVGVTDGVRYLLLRDGVGEATISRAQTGQLVCSFTRLPPRILKWLESEELP